MKMRASCAAARQLIRFFPLSLNLYCSLRKA